MSDIRMRKVKVSGGKHPDGAEWMIDVTVDYSDTPKDVLIDRAFKSDVITLQNGMFRPALGSQLDTWETDGYKTAGEQVGGKRAGIDPVAFFKNAGMTEEQAEKAAATPGLLKQAMDLLEKMTEASEEE